MPANSRPVIIEIIVRLSGRGLFQRDISNNTRCNKVPPPKTYTILVLVKGSKQRLGQIMKNL